jgi:hypothetical protein
MSKAKASVPVEEIMEYIEQPLTYREARKGVWKFEHAHKVSSAVVFSGKCPAPTTVSSDALFEWKSYYEFVCEVDRRVASALAERSKLEQVSYSAKPGSSETHPQTAEQRKHASMCVAA